MGGRFEKDEEDITYVSILRMLRCPFQIFKLKIAKPVLLGTYSSGRLDAWHYVPPNFLFYFFELKQRTREMSN